jgi:hypothetical protein
LNSKNRNPKATAAATATVITWCHKTFTPASSKPLSPKNPDKLRLSGGHVHCASPIKKTIRPTVTVNVVARLAPCNPRNIVRSITAPSSGASTTTTTISANGVGQSQWTRNCQ